MANLVRALSQHNTPCLQQGAENQLGAVGHASHVQCHASKFKTGTSTKLPQEDHKLGLEINLGQGWCDQSVFVFVWGLEPKVNFRMAGGSELAAC